MTLYWWTDKPIKEKYALIKPIPIEEIYLDCHGDGYCSNYLRLMNNGDEILPYEEEIIKYIEERLYHFEAKGYVTKRNRHNQQYQLMLGWSHIFKSQKS